MHFVFVGFGFQFHDCANGNGMVFNFLDFNYIFAKISVCLINRSNLFFQSFYFFVSFRFSIENFRIQFIQFHQNIVQSV